MAGANLRHVVVVNDHGSVTGGAAKVAIESALALRERGLGVSFVAGAAPVDPRLPAAGVDVVAIAPHDVVTDPDRRRAMQNGLWNAESARVLSQHLMGHDPAGTVVHLHTWTKALSPSIGPVITGSAVPHVVTLHEYFLACPNGAFYDYNAGQVCQKRAMGLACMATQCDSRKMSHKVWRMARSAVMRTAGHLPRGLRDIIYISPRQRSIMDGYFAEDAAWHYLPNAVAERPAQRVPVEDSDIFLFVGRISPEKGAVIAARAAREAGVRIVFAGEGGDREAVRQANPDAEMLGWLGAEELAQWMRRARCLVFPSLWYEGYPLVVVDALRIGLPVLVSDATVATAVVTDGLDGLHVPAGDVSAWARAMTRLRSGGTARSFGEAAFRTGGDLLGYDQYTAELIAIYERILARSR